MRYLLCLIIAFIILLAFQGRARLFPNDLRHLEGRWNGTLEYLDYSRNKKVSIPVSLRITRNAEYTWGFEYVYPEEPKANAVSIAHLSTDGAEFNAGMVVGRQRVNKTFQFSTEEKGRDNNREAVIRKHYTIGKRVLRIRKEIKYSNTDSFFVRNEYLFAR